MARESRERGKNPKLKPEDRKRVNRAWDAIEEGDPEAARKEAEELMEETNEHPEVQLVFGAALLESGFPSESLQHLRACGGQVDDSVVHGFYLASALYENHAIEEAETLYRKVLLEDRHSAPPHYGLAQCLEFMGRYEEAEAEYRKAGALDSESYPLPIRMKREAFEQVVQEAAESLPAPIRKHLDAIPVVVEDLPSRESLVTESTDEPITPAILGLFVGTSLPDKSVFEPEMIPATIFIYQRNLERICETREELIHEIRTTLYHELGHYLGLSEEELEERGLE